MDCRICSGTVFWESVMTCYRKLSWLLLNSVITVTGKCHDCDMILSCLLQEVSCRLQESVMTVKGKCQVCYRRVSWLLRTWSWLFRGGLKSKIWSLFWSIFTSGSLRLLDLSFFSVLFLPLQVCCVFIAAASVVLYRVFMTVDYCTSDWSAAQCLVVATLASSVMQAVTIMILGKVSTCTVFRIQVSSSCRQNKN